MPPLHVSTRGRRQEFSLCRWSPSPQASHHRPTRSTRRNRNPLCPPIPLPQHARTHARAHVTVPRPIQVATPAPQRRPSSTHIHIRTGLPALPQIVTRPRCSVYSCCCPAACPLLLSAAAAGCVRLRWPGRATTPPNRRHTSTRMRRDGSLVIANATPPPRHPSRGATSQLAIHLRLRQGISAILQEATRPVRPPARQTRP